MKFKRKLLKYTYLVKLIITAFIAIYIPFLLLNFFVMRNSYYEMKENENKNNFKNTYYFANYFYDQIDVLKNQAISIEYDRKFIREAVESHPYYMIEAIETLSQYKATINVADLCGVYFNDSNYLVTSTAKYDLDYFLQSYSEGDSKLYENIRNFLTVKHKNEVVMLPILNKSIDMSKALLVGVPISTGLPGEEDALVVYVLNSDVLRNSFFGSLDLKEYGLYIFDSNNDLLYSNGIINEETIHSTEFNEFIKDVNNTLFHFKNGKNEYSAFKWYDKTRNMTFVSVNLRDEIDETLLSFYITLQRTLILSAIAMVIILGTVTYVNYKPISKLSMRARKFTDENNDISEINSIDYMMEKMSSENNYMHETVSEQRMILKERVFSNLLSGILISEVEANLLDSFLKDKDNNFCVLSVHGLRLSNMQREQLVYSIYVNCGSHVNITDIINENYIIFICTINKDINYRDVTTVIGDFLKQFCNSDFYIGVGIAVTNIGDIRRSYLCSLYALNTRAGIAYFEDLPKPISNAGKYSNLNIDILAFLQYVKNGDKDSALSVLSNMNEYILKNDINVKKERYICYNILCSYLRTLEEANITIEAQKAEDILDFNNINEFCKIISNSVRDVCKRILINKEDSNFAFKKSMINFVDINVTDPNICLLQVADKFNISIYTLSRVFKESTGIGFKEYITSKRIDLSKHLLIATNKSIFEIANDVGFIDTTQFTRVFKSLCGIAPSKYKSHLTSYHNQEMGESNNEN